MSETTDIHQFKFKLEAGYTQRRILMSEIADWLRVTVGTGCFSIHADFTPTDFAQSLWIIVPYSHEFLVYLKNESDATLFALKWT